MSEPSATVRRLGARLRGLAGKAIEDYLRRRRREVDEIFDYRYSRLLLVFAGLAKVIWMKRSRKIKRRSESAGRLDSNGSPDASSRRLA